MRTNRSRTSGAYVIFFCLVGNSFKISRFRQTQSDSLRHGKLYCMKTSQEIAFENLQKQW